ncbi:Bgt-5086 [Blumeria graminis f. sp. tritici]|uniref:5'-3' exoribonuclease 1 n=2 Tax=Blumeria graminis f. sp. tritici TaxID=62690 RepID=A0A061HH87_BLUGR|nr:hypothetical protein BGT96224_5086 [Blumeria graminis f. sp. tritici 96224]VCU39321.1 Bgt-5086 [Blumeria graminis f. sp. tritici]
MGVPKFFRWMSERYPAISQLIAENRIPEFDCLYFDMNGIIHNCTHKDSDDATFRMTEEQMFISIFNYIEHLYAKIKPKQLFFMAIDGVAPRAKMNQQRARRFRTALDVELARERAIREGKEIPKEDAFDSNSITPGTEFMHKLTRQLKYFINKKVSTDQDWKGVDIVLSGHEVPGEGEHKIMEYIRLAKAQPNYDPNTRHCLYGLDADLIMLGLLSHDPHFCLLREEVTFGRASKSKSKELEHQKFFLMHLCIVREYLALEFQELNKPGALEFGFDIERIIDDFILLAFFVGNDFLPNLPNLHINEGALGLMFQTYKSILPEAGGYLNERGVINMDRLAILLRELSHVESRVFETENSDQNWLRSLQKSKRDEKIANKTEIDGITTMTSQQKEVWKKIKEFITKRQTAHLDLPIALKANDRKLFQDLAEKISLEWRTVENEDGDRHMRLSFLPLSENEEEVNIASQNEIQRVIKQFDDTKIYDASKAESRAETSRLYDEKFLEWKDKYYKGKFDWGRSNTVELTKLCENYVQGLQWVLFYYYRGVVSWSWFYRYHYSPLISDVIKGVDADFNFKLGQPFRPFEQLMGVLPDRSKGLIPTVYRDLMTDPESPIIDFYPRDFELDMNGKKMEWEAVVKIPFIDENRLLGAMSTRNNMLSDEERKRNDFGVSLKFTYDSNTNFIYKSSLVGIFENIDQCRCVENTYDLPTIGGLDYHIGLIDGVKLGDAALAGFPSLSTLPYNATLCFHGVNMFQADSRNESIIVTLEDTPLRANAAAAKMKLGQRVFVGYPYLQEGKVFKVTDELFTYLPSNDGSPQPIQKSHSQREIEEFNKKSERIEDNYSKRLGILIGQVESITHVEILKGLKKTGDGAVVKEYGIIPGIEVEYASQIIVDEVISEDPRFLEREAIPIEEEFPPGTSAFFLSPIHYGQPLETIGLNDNLVEIWLSKSMVKEPDFGHQIISEKYHAESSYTPAFSVAQLLGLNALALSKITSSFVISTPDSPRLNLGLNLKFESKKLKVLGYTRKSDRGWEYSNKAIELIASYMSKFPEFFAGIQRNVRANEYHETDFYPPEIASIKIKEIVAWLKSIESKNFEKVPLDAEQLEADVVQAIEKACDDAFENMSNVIYTRLKNVPRNALIKPSDAENRLGHQKFELGDRVVYVQDSGRVPIACRGVVVGISRTARTVLLDVVFDASFMSGTDLGNRCSPYRGSTIPASSVINLTNKQAVVGNHLDEGQQETENISSSVNGRYISSHRPGGRGNYYSAEAPPKGKLSFRDAAAGKYQNGHSYGNTNRPEFKQTYGSFSENHGHVTYGGNTQSRGSPRGRGVNIPFRRQDGSRSPICNFTAVPPPSSLNAGRDSPGRGRGSGRGRAENRGSRWRGT